jgi:PAT family beta-lactamase induction signal transducer AmpG
MKRLVLLSTFVGIFYFSEGLPYGLITELFPLYLRQSGVSLAQIGLLSTIGLVWTLKLFWAPLVDTFGTYQRWISGALLLISASLLPFAFTDLTGSGVLWLLLALMAIGSATQDIAVDAYTIAVTPRQDLGVVNAVRITAFRVGIILTGGGLAALASRSSWPTAFAVAACVSAALLVLSFFLPPLVQSRQKSTLWADLRDWINRPSAGAVLLTVLLYRIGDSALRPMIKPFWVDRGYSAAEIGTVTTTIGLTFTILGGICGGWFVTRYGIYRALLWLGVVQMLSNVGYAWAAMTEAGRPVLYTAALIEPFADGLGTAAFLAFLMAICDRTRAATEYALLSALFGLSRSLIGTFSGISAQSLGYAPFFWITVALGLPGLLCIPFVRPRLDTEESASS